MRNTFLALGALLVLTSTAAAEGIITELEITKSGDEIVVSWENPDDLQDQNAEGVALQWGENSGDIGPGESINQRLGISEELIRLRTASFEQGEYIYFFASAYYRGGFNDRDTFLTACGTGVKYRFNADGTEESTAVAIDCSDQGDDDTNSSEVDTTTRFSKITATPYEKDIIIKWRRPQIANNEADLMKFYLSENDDMSDPVLTFQADFDDLSARVSNAKPGTKYYIQAVLKKGTSEFSDSDIVDTETDAKYTDAEQIKFERQSKNGLIQLGADLTVDMANGVGDEAAEAVTEDAEADVAVVSAPATTATASGAGFYTSTQIGALTDAALISHLKEVQQYRLRLRAEQKRRNPETYSLSS